MLPCIYMPCIIFMYPHLQSIQTALDEALPSRLDSLQSALLEEGQPFTTYSFLLPYLPYAPQKALASIYEVYWRYVQYYSNVSLCVFNTAYM